MKKIVAILFFFCSAIVHGYEYQNDHIGYAFEVPDRLEESYAIEIENIVMHLFSDREGRKVLGTAYAPFDEGTEIQEIFDQLTYDILFSHIEDVQEEAEITGTELESLLPSTLTAKRIQIEVTLKDTGEEGFVDIHCFSHNGHIISLIVGGEDKEELLELLETSTETLRCFAGKEEDTASFIVSGLFTDPIAGLRFPAPEGYLFLGETSFLLGEYQFLEQSGDYWTVEVEVAPPVIYDPERDPDVTIHEVKNLDLGGRTWKGVFYEEDDEFFLDYHYWHGDTLICFSCSDPSLEVIRKESKVIEGLLPKVTFVK